MTTTRKAEIDKVLADLQVELPDSNPYLTGSFLRALGVSVGGRAFDFFLELDQLNLNSYPDTATGDAIIRWGLPVRVSRKAASISRGYLIVTGTPGTQIPAGTIFQGSNGAQVTSTTSESVSDSSTGLTLTFSGATASATVAVPHRFATGNVVVVAGAIEPAYNGTFSIVVTSDTTFQYTMLSTPPNNATGSPIASLNTALVYVESNVAGVSQNASSGAILGLVSPITGIDANSRVYYSNLSGGTDLESLAGLSARVNDAWKSPPNRFNANDIKHEVLGIQGVTRVWVVSPSSGQVDIRFMRDGDPVPIPSGSAVATVNAVVDAIRPGVVSPNDVSVSGPVGASIGVTFSALTPNTVEMQTAITSSLQAFFAEKVDYQTDVALDGIKSAVMQAFDMATGSRVKSFALTSTPTDVGGLIAIASGEIGTLGAIVYPVI